MLEIELGNKIEKLTVAMSRLAAKENHEKRPFKFQISKNRGQNRSFNQENFQNRPGNRNRGQNTSLDKIIEIVVPKETSEDMEDKIADRYRNDRHNDYNRGRNRSIERIFTRNYNSSRDRSPSNSRSRSDSRANMNRDRIRCYRCREYNHFARDCPNSREERELERLQQILDMDTEEQTYRQDSSIESHRGPLTYEW